MMALFLPLLLAALAGPATAEAAAPAIQAVQPQPLTHPVFIVRHLEKADGDDPELSARGKANARRLADHLADAGIKAVFVTRTRRAAETGAMVAERAGIAPTYYDHRELPALQDAVATADGPVLIVGHSNTVPDLVAAFGGAKPPPLADEDYGTVWRLAPGGETGLHQLGAGERG